MVQTGLVVDIAAIQAHPQLFHKIEGGERKMFVAKVAPSIAGLILSASGAIADCTSPLPAQMSKEQLTACLVEISTLRNDIKALKEQMAQQSAPEIIVAEVDANGQLINLIGGDRHHLIPKPPGTNYHFEFTVDPPFKAPRPIIFALPHTGGWWSQVFLKSDGVTTNGFGINNAAPSNPTTYFIPFTLVIIAK
jgi:hypothetical protein